MKKTTRNRIIWLSLISAVLAGVAFLVLDILQERTIIPATEYDEDEDVPSQVDNSTGSPAGGDSSVTVDTMHPTTRVPRTGGPVSSVFPIIVDPNAPASTTTTTVDPVTGAVTVVPPTAAAVGRQLKPSDFHINHKLNARLRFGNFLNTFKEGDYVTGMDLAILYGNDKEINTVVRKIVVKYFHDNIDYIQRKNGELIINTVDQKPAVTRIHVPLLIDMNLTINHGSKIILGKTFVSKESKFNNIWMLPLNLQDIEVKQSNDPMPSQGYVSGDNFYTNYPGSLDCYKLK